MKQRPKAKAEFGAFRRNSHVPKRKAINWLAGITGLVGFASLALVLVGFGVALSMEAWGEMPYGTLYSSPAELIALSSVAILRFVDHFGNLSMAWQVAAGVFSFGTLAAFTAAIIIGIAEWPGSSVTHRMREVKRRIRERLRAHFSSRSRTKALIHSLLTGAVAFFAVPIVAVAILWVWLAGIVVLTAMPLVGYTMGKLYIREYVTGPSECASGRPTVHRVATCLTVQTKEFGPYTGRLVYSTSSVLVLYVTETSGSTKLIRVPLVGAIVTTEVPVLKNSSVSRATKTK